MKLLAGVPDPRLQRAGLDRTPTFGVARASTPSRGSTQLLRRCVTAGWVDFTPGDQPVVLLTDAGRAVMKGERPARLLLPREHEPERGAAPPRAASPGARAARARRDGPTRLPPKPRRSSRRCARCAPSWPAPRACRAYVVASDRTLRDIALLRPRDARELKLAHGIGPAKAERYGARILAVVAQASPSA